MFSRVLDRYADNIPICIQFNQNILVYISRFEFSRPKN